MVCSTVKPNSQEHSFNLPKTDVSVAEQKHEHTTQKSIYATIFSQLIDGNYSVSERAHCVLEGRENIMDILGCIHETQAE